MKWIGASAEHVMGHSVESVWEFVSNIENFGRWADVVQESQMEFRGRTRSGVDV